MLDLDKLNDFAQVLAYLVVILHERIEIVFLDLANVFIDLVFKVLYFEFIDKADMTHFFDTIGIVEHHVLFNQFFLP